MRNSKPQIHPAARLAGEALKMFTRDKTAATAMFKVAAEMYAEAPGTPAPSPSNPNPSVLSSETIDEIKCALDEGDVQKAIDLMQENSTAASDDDDDDAPPSSATSEETEFVEPSPTPPQTPPSRTGASAQSKLTSAQVAKLVTVRNKVAAKVREKPELRSALASLDEILAQQ